MSIEFDKSRLKRFSPDRKKRGGIGRGFSANGEPIHYNSVIRIFVFEPGFKILESCLSFVDGSLSNSQQRVVVHRKDYISASTETVRESD